MTIDSDEDLEGLLRAGRVVAEARNAMVAAVKRESLLESSTQSDAKCFVGTVRDLLLE